jgi:subtilisin family serine protease
MRAASRLTLLTLVPLTLHTGCACKRPSVVGEPRLASISIRAEARDAAPLRLGNTTLFGATATPATRDELQALAQQLQHLCGESAEPCVSGVTAAKAIPEGIRGMAGPASPTAESLLVCGRTELAPNGTTRTAPGFRTLLRRAEDAAAASGGKVRVVRHHVWDYAPAPDKPGKDEPAAATEAQAHPEWPLEQINLQAAIDAVRTKKGQEPGAGITVAHFDTGYARSCHFWTDTSPCPVAEELGYDFFTCSVDPKDPMTPGSLPESRQPGHGTRTGGLIVSPHAPPPGCQPIVDFAKVKGVAPAAHLVPIRVSDGILLGMPKSLKAIMELVVGIDVDHRVLSLATGIDHASRSPSLLGGGEGAVLPEVMSISMGGICAESQEEKKTNETLRLTLQRAELKGVLVVAAAGQYPVPNFFRRLLVGDKFPVSFPGSYPSVVTVAGSTILGKPWSKSARGRKVDVTAPGYHVWRAAPDPQVPAMGDGTSFATAITAGAAALWVQYHGRGELWKRYGPALTSAFRWVLAHGGTRPPAALCADLRPKGYGPALCSAVQGYVWKTAEFGPGLLDAAGVLRTPLPTREQVCEAEKRRRSPTDLQNVCPSRWPPGLGPAARLRGES